MTAALEGGEWSAARPGRNLPPGKTRYPFYRRLGGPQGWSGRAEIHVPTGIRSRTFQPVAQSLYRLSYPAHVHIYIESSFSKAKLNLFHRAESFPEKLTVSQPVKKFPAFYGTLKFITAFTSVGRPPGPVLRSISPVHVTYPSSSK